MDQDITIDVATAADGDQIADLYLASRADALGRLRKVHADEAVRTWIKTTLVNRGVVWVARRQAEILGFLALEGEHVDQLYLLPGYYRGGIGSRLLAMAKSASSERLNLYTFHCNDRARAFYEAHGFRAMRFGDGSENEEGEPDIFYEWRAEPAQPFLDFPATSPSSRTAAK